MRPSDLIQIQENWESYLAYETPLGERGFPFADGYTSETISEEIQSRVDATVHEFTAASSSYHSGEITELDFYLRIIDNCSRRGRTVRQLGLEYSPGRLVDGVAVEARLRHFIALHVMAKEMIEAGYEILDIDGLHLEGMPHKSDITARKNKIPVFIDMTSDAGRLVQKKNSLRALAEEFDFEFACAAVWFKPSDWLERYRYKIPKKPETTQCWQMDFMRDLSNCLAETRSVEKSRESSLLLLRTLNTVFSPSMAFFIQDKMPQSQHVPTAYPSDEEKEGELRKMAINSGTEMISENPVKFSRYLEAMSGIEYREGKDGSNRDLKYIETAVPTTDIKELLRMAEILSESDPFFFCFWRTQQTLSCISMIGDEWEQTIQSIKPMVVVRGPAGFEQREIGSNMREKTLVKALSKTQGPDTFAGCDDIVAVYKPVVKVMWFDVKSDGSRSRVADLATRIPPGVTRVPEINKFTKTFQILLNPVYYNHDSSFSKMLNARKGVSRKVNYLPVSSGHLVECYAKERSRVHPDNKKWLSDKGVVRGSVELAERKGPGYISNLYDKESLLSDLVENETMAKLDHASSRSHSFAKMLQSVQAANTVTVFHNEDYMSWTIAYVNNKFMKFKTTWTKTVALQHDGEYFSYGFRSINRKNLSWQMQAPLKALTRLSYLTEQRQQHYRENPEFAREETEWSIQIYKIDRLQFSVLCKMLRFLHCSLSSIYVKPGKVRGYDILKKNSNLRLNSSIEVAMLATMLSNFSAASELIDTYGPRSLRLGNGHFPMCTPDLLLATNDFSHMVSLYSLSNIGIKEKFDNKLVGEARCSEIILEMAEEQENAKRANEEMYYGLEVEAEQFMMHPNENSVRYIARLCDHINRKELVVDRLQKRLLEDIAELGDAQPYQSSFFYELWCNLSASHTDGVRLAGSLSTLAGESLRDRFSTRGSLMNTDYGKFETPNNRRKTTSMLSLIAEYHFQTQNLGEISYKMLSDNNLHKTCDEYTICLWLMSQWSEISPDILITDKDAFDKWREISTLNYKYAFVSMSREKMIRQASLSLTEDMISEPNKEREILNMTNLSEKAKEDEMALFFSQDKSKFGPTSRFTNFYATLASYMPDLITSIFCTDIVSLTTQRRVRFPTALLRATVLKGPKSPCSFQGMSDVCKVMYGTSVVSRMGRKIYDQIKGNECMPCGIEGTPSLQLESGMDGQGIVGGLRSLGVSSIYSTMIKLLPDWLKLTIRVTSDDSGVVAVFKRTREESIRQGFLDILVSFVGMAGLIENRSKLIISTVQFELNSFFVLRGEPCSPILKFLIAQLQYDTTGSLEQDLQSAASISGSLMAKGASVFSSTMVASCAMAGLVKSYGLSHISRYMCILPAIMGGYPQINPFVQMTSGLGSLICNIVGATERPDGGHGFGVTDQDCVDYVLAKKFSMPKATLTSEEFKVVEDMQVIDEGFHRVVIPASKEALRSNFRILARQDRRTVKLSLELGSEFIVASRKCKPGSKISLHGIMSALSQDLRTPLSEPRMTPDLFNSTQKVSHAKGFKSVVIPVESLYYKGDGDTQERIDKEELTRRILRPFQDPTWSRERLDNAKKHWEVGDWVSPLRSALTRHVLENIKTIRTMNKDLMYSNCSCEYTSTGTSGIQLADPKCQDVGEVPRDKHIVNRARLGITVLRPQLEVSIDLGEIELEMCMELCSHEQASRLPLELRQRLSLREKPPDIESEPGIYDVISTMLQSVRSLAPRPKQIYTVQTGQGDQTYKLSQTLIYNSHRSIVLIDGRLQEGLGELSGGSHGTILRKQFTESVDYRSKYTELFYESVLNSIPVPTAGHALTDITQNEFSEYYPVPHRSQIPLTIHVSGANHVRDPLDQIKAEWPLLWLGNVQFDISWKVACRIVDSWQYEWKCGTSEYRVQPENRGLSFPMLVQGSDYHIWITRTRGVRTPFNYVTHIVLPEQDRDIFSLDLKEYKRSKRDKTPGVYNRYDLQGLYDSVSARSNAGLKMALLEQFKGETNYGVTDTVVIRFGYGSMSTAILGNFPFLCSGNLRIPLTNRSVPLTPTERVKHLADHLEEPTKPGELMKQLRDGVFRDSKYSLLAGAREMNKSTVNSENLERIGVMATSLGSKSTAKASYDFDDTTDHEKLLSTIRSIKSYPEYWRLHPHITDEQVDSSPASLMALWIVQRMNSLARGFGDSEMNELYDQADIVEPMTIEDMMNMIDDEMDWADE